LRPAGKNRLDDDGTGQEDGRMMKPPIATYVHCGDPISAAGAQCLLRMHSEIRLIDELAVDEAEVAVVITDEIDDDTLRVLRAIRRGERPRLVVVATSIDDAGLVSAAEVGVCGLVRRADATAEALVRTVTRVHDGHGDIPADLLGRLLDQMGRLQRTVLAPKGLTFAQLSQRETAVLRLVAEGHDTAEIAREICYSERTVKNVLHDLTTRLQLRNRTQAVAYAVREGLI
jgi:DNA-binding NarL/FixJ family response regulator